MAQLRHPEEFTDTDPRAMKVWRELMREKPAGEKFALAFQLTEFAMKMSEAGVRAAYPHASAREVFLRAAARRLPRELVIRAYGWDPESNVVPV